MAALSKDESIHKIVAERDLLRAKNDTLLLITGWLIGVLVRNKIPIPDEVQHLLDGLGLAGFKKRP